MNSHWTESDSIELLQISINNYPKFVHLKKNNEPDHFFDDRIFSKFHNLGRNGKSIKSRIETVQKKFRKAVRSMDINKFKDGIIDGDSYKLPESRELFNTSFEFERLFGKYCGSKELMKIIEVVCHSVYWDSNRKRIHPRWSKRLSTNSSNEDLNSTNTNGQNIVHNPIVISSAETSDDDLSSFKDKDFVITRKRKTTMDSNLLNAALSKELSCQEKNGSPFSKLRLLGGVMPTDLDSDCIPVCFNKVSIETQTDIVEESRSLTNSVSVMTDFEAQNSTTAEKESILSYSKMSSIDVQPLADLNTLFQDNPLCRTIFSTFAPVVTDVSGIHDSLNDISQSLRQLVQIMSSSTSSK